MNTDEENHLKTDILLETEEDQGLSTLDKLHIVELWQHPVEGIITYKLRGSDEEFDLSELKNTELEGIYKQLNEQY